MGRYLFVTLLLMPFLIWGFSEQALAAEWNTLKTRYLNIHYQSESDLRKFDKKIKPVKNAIGFSSFSGGSAGSEGELAAKMDTLFQKVQLLLDMRKPFTVDVRIYPGKSALERAYFKIYKKNRSLRAWYIFEYNTVYVSVDDLFAGMLAHELAHAIVDNYLAVRPPRATAEILARYVDGHLNKKAKTY
jgi:hypothetical protein